MDDGTVIKLKITIEEDVGYISFLGCDYNMGRGRVCAHYLSYFIGKRSV